MRTRDIEDCIENGSAGKAPAKPTATMAYDENFMVIAGVSLPFKSARRLDLIN